MARTFVAHPKAWYSPPKTSIPFQEISKEQEDQELKGFPFSFNCGFKHCKKAIEDLKSPMFGLSKSSANVAQIEH